jgi:hypothetical protein
MSLITHTASRNFMVDVGSYNTIGYPCLRIENAIFILLKLRILYVGRSC